MHTCAASYGFPGSSLVLQATAMVPPRVPCCILLLSLLAAGAVARQETLGEGARISARLQWSQQHAQPSPRIASQQECTPAYCLLFSCAHTRAC
jgi:hypothetical protein